MSRSVWAVVGVVFGAAVWAFLGWAFVVAFARFAS